MHKRVYVRIHVLERVYVRVHGAGGDRYQLVTELSCMVYRYAWMCFFSELLRSSSVSKVSDSWQSGNEDVPQVEDWPRE